jgi:hypothetical protein
MNTIVIGTINHSDIGVMNAPTERNFVVWGPHFVEIKILSHFTDSRGMTIGRFDDIFSIEIYVIYVRWM